MSSPTRRRIVVAAALSVAVLVGLYSVESTASKEFTMAMEEGARKDWDAAFNKVVAEPFTKVECSAGAKNRLSLGSGCVDIGSELVCCSDWTIGIKCTAERKWHQTDIGGSGCEKRPAKK